MSLLCATGAGLEELGRVRYCPPALARAFVDPGVVKLFLATSARSERAILTARQLDEDRAEPSAQRRRFAAFGRAWMRDWSAASGPFLRVLTPHGKHRFARRKVSGALPASRP